MPAANVCWGIEIGSGAVKGLKLSADGDKLTVLEVAVVEHKKVLSTPQLDQDDAMRVALGALASQYDLSGASVAISVPGQAAFARFAKLPPVEPRKVPDIVKFEAKQQIPFPLEEVEWDYQTFASPDSPDVEVGMFAILKNKIAERLRLYADLGIQPDIVTLSPAAVYNAMAYDLEFTEQTAGTILLDVGTSSTDLVIAEAGRVWMRTFPIGGHQFTEALVEAFKVSYAKAEKLKREAEQDASARQVFQAMRPVFGDLAQDVQRSIQYYQSLHKDANLTRLIGMGSTFRLPGMRRYLKQQLQMNVYRLESFKRLGVEGPRAAEFQNAAITLGTAYGLALQGLGLGTLEANLMPVAALRAGMWKRKVRWFGVAAGVSALTGAAMCLRPFIDEQRVLQNAPPGSINETISKAERLKQQAQEVTGSSAPDYTGANLLLLTSDRGVYAHLLDDVGAMLADATALAKDRPVPEGRPAPPEGPAFTLLGLTTQYIGPGGILGGRGVGRSSGFTDPSDPAAAEAMARPRQVLVRMEVDTFQSTPREFMIQSIQRWLETNAQREGVPYRILVEDSVPWKTTGEQRYAEASATGAPVTGAEAVAPPPSQPGRPPGDRGAQPPGRQNPTRAGGGQQPPAEVTRTGEGSAGGAPTWAPSQTAAEVDQVAKLTPPPDPKPPGSVRTVFEVTWVLELVPEAKEGGR